MPLFESDTLCSVFVGHRRLATGPLATVAVQARDACQADPGATVLVLDDLTSRQVELNLVGSPEDLQASLRAMVGGSSEHGRTTIAPAGAAPSPNTGSGTGRGRGRPKLGVTAREVTLLPRHWDWLATQPGGASAALRRLVEQARRDLAGADAQRAQQAVAYRFMLTLAGDLENFEAANRALYGADAEAFAAASDAWPKDVRDHARRLAQPVFAAAAEA